MVTSGPPGGGTWTGLTVTIAGLVVAALIVLLVEPLRDAAADAISGDTASVREDLRDLGATGVLMVFALAQVHVIVWYPAEILDAATGYVYGFGWGLPLVFGSWMVSGVVAYYVGRHAARPALYRLAGEERFERAESAIHAGGATVLLIARLVPIVPFSLMSMVCGAAHVPMARFLWTMAVGYLPITAYFTYLGSKLEGFSLEDPIVWIGAAAFVLAIFGVRYLLPRRLRGGAEAG
jgi:uncharacterized membrane protein YdjX (TVP38/TMEM64 family)